jgi:uncharacterized protein (TIGR03437 family)
MRLAWALAAVAWCATAAGTPPFYSAASIVNVSDYAAGPFAPNSLISIFGTDLSWSTHVLSADDISGNFLPTELNYTQVFVNNSPVPLLYVSPDQINFVMPPNSIPGESKVRVVRQGMSGPEVKIPVVEASPALFDSGSGYIIATHADNSIISEDSPARGGELIVIYVCGLGKTTQSPRMGEIPQYAALLAHPEKLQIHLGEVAVEGSRIAYAGITPGCAGLYQINVWLPENAPADPEIRVYMGQQGSRPGLKLRIRETAQPIAVGVR